MKVTQVAIRPTEASLKAKRPSLTPELLAASGARYSRNNEGLEAIFAKIDPNNLDKSVDSIFRMIDYGHQSIADMAPIAMFIDGISLWLAYYVWTLCPTAGGQESSTRFIKMSVDGLIDPAILGIPDSTANEWGISMADCFTCYQQALSIWEALASARPELVRIPSTLLSERTDSARKKIARMQRNYGFDRARYYLPAAASTNVMLVMSARGWVDLCQHLCSHILLEARKLGDAIIEELALCAPRMISHATEKPSIRDGIRMEFEQLRKLASENKSPFLSDSASCSDHPPTPSLDIMCAPGVSREEFQSDLSYHDNRYAWIGGSLKRTAVRFSWAAVSFGEIRDLNRHRTGNKFCPLVPVGFYSALDQLPDKSGAACESLKALDVSNRRLSARANALLGSGEPTYVYWLALGTQFPFEHLTTADKFIYEAELRTGTGAHFRYAQHLRDMLTLWYVRYPETKGFILEGSAEPD
jgi:thymidylate synthase ThyX